MSRHVRNNYQWIESYLSNTSVLLCVTCYLGKLPVWILDKSGIQFPTVISVTLGFGLLFVLFWGLTPIGKPQKLSPCSKNWLLLNTVFAGCFEVIDLCQNEIYDRNKFLQKSLKKYFLKWHIPSNSAFM